MIHICQIITRIIKFFGIFTDVICLKYYSSDTIQSAFLVFFRKMLQSYIQFQLKITQIIDGVEKSI